MSTPRLRILLCAVLCLSFGCGTLGGTWAGGDATPGLRDARRHVEAGQPHEGKRIYQEVLATTRDRDGLRAEVLYELALLYLSDEPSLYDPEQSLALLQELQSGFPKYQPEVVEALVQVLDDLVATRRDLGKQLATLRSVNENLDEQRQTLKSKNEELSRVTQDLERQKAALKRVTETVIGPANGGNYER